MGRKPAKDLRYLELHRGKWRVTMAVPRELRAELGTRLKRPLNTDSLAMANALKWEVVSEFRRALDTAKAKAGTHSLQQEALSAAAHLRNEKSEHWREAILDGIVERAEQIRGLPIAAEHDPIFGGVDYRHDPAREARADEYAELALGRATPIAQFHANYLAGEQTKARTRADDERALRHLLTWCASKELRPTLQAITRRTAAQFKDEMRQVVGDLAPVTLNKYLGRLSHYWQWLERRNHVKVNPWAGHRVQKPRVADRDQERPFTDAEVTKLLSGPALPRMHDLMRIAALSGARLEAIVDLRVRDCQDGLLEFKPQKSEPKARQVPMHPDLAEIIARRTRGKASEDGLFPEWPLPKRAGSKRERSFKASAQFTEYRRAVGVDAVVEGKRRSLVNFHSFRRWFITKAEQAGQPETVIAVVVGHKRKGTTLGTYSGGPLWEQMRTCVQAVTLPATSEVHKLSNSASLSG